MKKIVMSFAVAVTTLFFTVFPQGLTGFIVYAGVEGDGNGTFIYAISPDGSIKKRLTTGTRSDNYPAVSPDGSTVVFSSAGVDYKNRLYLMESDGSEIREIAATENDAELASWSPDGKRIAFLDRDSSHVTSIYVIDSDGKNLKRIVSHCAHHDDYQYPPEWSADGKYILYNKIVTDDKDDNFPECMYLVNTDGSGEMPFGGGEQTRIDGNFSPDGSRVVYYMEKREMNYNRIDNVGTFIIDSDGTNETYLVPGYKPVWSPDGAYIAYTAADLNYSNAIFIMYPDGTGPGRTETRENMYYDEMEEGEAIPLQITFDGTGGVKDPVWSPDSKKITFVTNTSEVAESALWVVDVSGNSRTALATNVLGRTRPSWR